MIKPFLGFVEMVVWSQGMHFSLGQLSNIDSIVMATIPGVRASYDHDREISSVIPESMPTWSRLMSLRASLGISQAIIVHRRFESMPVLFDPLVEVDRW